MAFSERSHGSWRSAEYRNERGGAPARSERDAGAYGEQPERYGPGHYDASANAGDRFGERRFRTRESPYRQQDERAGWGDTVERYARGRYGYGEAETWRGAAWPRDPELSAPDAGRGVRYPHDRELYAATERGEYRGRGPKGYRRSDERIHDDVCECLTDDDHVDASEIEVSVKDGEVTLAGTVNSRMEKRRAEEVVEHISGVHDVHNRLRVVSIRSAESTAGQSAAEPTPSPQTNQRH